MRGARGVQKTNARVTVPRESVLFTRWSCCPTAPVSDEPTLLQATWREQAHRARKTMRLTCFAAALTGPRGPSLVISRLAGHGTRVMSRRNVSAHHFVSSHHAQNTQGSYASSHVIETSTTEDNTQRKWRGTRMRQHVCLKLENNCLQSMST